MDKGGVTQVLNEMATLLQLMDANPFRVRAFQNGARVIEGLSQDLEILVREKKLITLKGIGEGLAHIITELVQKGKSKEHEQLKKKVPDSVLEMLTIQGLGPQKVNLLYKKLKIKTIHALETACKKHKLSPLRGFGEKTEENILKGIEQKKKNSGKHMYPQAFQEAEKLKNYLLKSAPVKQLEVGGSLRRKKEFIGDIDILINSPQPEKVMKAFMNYPEAERTLAQGSTKCSIVLTTGMNADLRVVSDQQFPTALHYFTGSKEHNTELRRIAKAKGYKLNEYGLFKGSKRIDCKSEAQLFNKFGLDYIEPELRENNGEFEAARAHQLPHPLVQLQDLKGSFHNHTTYSDGVASLEEMIEKAQEIGLHYIGISDHSQAATYANGLKPDRLKKLFKEIDRLNGKLKKIRIFKGGEVDILKDGSLDYPDSLLATFDFVIASVHSSFKMPQNEMTQRIVKALKNKYVTMIGHPTGRLLLAREAYPVNLNKIVDVASDYGKAMELNANPHRLDIDWQICKYAKAKKVLVSINPDAHSINGISDIQWGIGIARKGWLTKKDVLNTRGVKEIEAFFKSYR